MSTTTEKQACPRNNQFSAKGCHIASAERPWQQKKVYAIEYVRLFQLQTKQSCVRHSSGGMFLVTITEAT